MKQINKVFNAVLNALSGSLVPLIPVLIAASLFKTATALLGPDVLGWLGESDDLYRLLDFVGDAGFYFLPVYAGYTSAAYFKLNGLLGMFLGGILIHPNYVALTEPLNFGITIPVVAYSGTILPILLSCWIMSYVHKLWVKVIPNVLQDVFVPFLTILVMVPIALCVVGPSGAWAGQFVCGMVMGLSSFGGIGLVLSVALIGAFWQFIVMCGMHWIFITTIITMMAAGQVDQLIFPAAIASSFSVGGMCLGAFLALKNKEEKAQAASFVVAQCVGGVTEPGLYGVGFKYRKPLAAMMIGGFAGALYSGITGVVCTNLVPVASFLVLLGFTGGGTANVANACIAMAIGFCVSAAVSYILMRKKESSADELPQ